MPKKKKLNGNMKIYCIKCKDYTDTKNIHHVTLKNGTHAIQGNCAICGTKKTRFISKKQGEGLLGSLLGLPDGKIPLLGDLPIVGQLF